MQSVNRTICLCGGNACCPLGDHHAVRRKHRQFFQFLADSGSICRSAVQEKRNICSQRYRNFSQFIHAQSIPGQFLQCQQNSRTVCAAAAHASLHGTPLFNVYLHAVCQPGSIQIALRRFPGNIFRTARHASHITGQCNVRRICQFHCDCICNGNCLENRFQKVITVRTSSCDI